jgi:hypothetical protein
VFLKNGSVIRCLAFLHWLRLGTVRQLRRYYQGTMTSCRPSHRTSFPSLGGTSVVLAVFAPRRTSTAAEAWSCSPGNSGRILPRRRQDLSSSWRTQMSVCTCSSTPAGLLAPDLIRSSSVAHAMTKAKAPCGLSISKLNSMAFGLAVYASQCWLPSPTQDSLPAVGQTLLDGLSTRRVPMKGFRVASLHTHPPLPSFT